MKKIIPILFLIGIFSSCIDRDPELVFPNDPVNADLLFLVLYIPCQDTEDPACAARPIVDATIEIYKEEEGAQPRFIAEGKTNKEGRLTIFDVPLGSYQVEVSTNEYGDKTTKSTSFLGRTSEDRIKFF